MKVLKIFFLFLLLFFVGAKPAYSSGEFLVDSHLEYKVSDSGNVDVTNTIKINNQKSVVFPKGYSLTFNKYAPFNLKVYENGRLLKTDFSQNGDDHNYLINFENLDVGVGNTKIFLVTYEIDSFAKKTGDTWEISVPYPEKSEDYASYKISLIVPKSFGRENFLSTKPTSVIKKEDTTIFTFEKSKNVTGNIYVSFGEFQTYDFAITYHLENPLDQKSYSEIAIIPDTNYQRVYYENIIPKPEKIYRDKDGNFIAGFNFKPREKIDIKTIGYIQVFGVSTQMFDEGSEGYLAQNLKEDNFWEVGDPAVQKISETLKLPRAIYDYLISNMAYDESKITDFKFERLGAKRALLYLDQSLCMEFTDAFIALARASNIPAREINGYAVTDDKAAKPLSLVSDVLHAWPEYWDSEKKAWIPVDPTWGKTSGINYFDNFDMKHIVFAIHGTNSSQPYSAGTYKLGSDPQKDVLISLKNFPPEKKAQKVDIHYKSLSTFNPFTEQVQITVTNNGNMALYGVTSEARLGEATLASDSYPFLLPFSSFTRTITVPYKFLGINMPSEVTYKVQGNETHISIHKNSKIIIHLLFIFILFSGFLTLIIRYIQKLKATSHA